MQAAGRGVSREIDVDVNADTSSLKGFNAELTKASKSMTTTSKDADRAGSSISTFTKRVVTANQGLDLMGKGVGLIKFPALIAGASYAAQAVNNLAAGATSLVGALSPLAGLLGAAPALYGVLGQAAGVVALSGVSELGEAVGGLNEKMDKTGESFKALSPQAQKLAKSLNQLKGPIREIQADVQQPLFEGMNRGIDEATKNLPAFRDVMVATSEELGKLAEEAGRFAGREGFGRDFEVVGKNNAQLLGRLGEAGLLFADALRHVMVEAQPLVDFLGRAVVDLAAFVENETKAARESGALRDFFRETKDLLMVLTPMLADFGAGLWNIIRAGKPLGDDILGVLADSAEEFRKWTESASGKNAIVQWFREAQNPLEQTAKLMRDIGELFFDVGQGGGLANLIKSLRKELLPVLGDVLESGKGFGPVFKNFVIEFGKALKPFLGSSGPLTLFVKSLTTVLRVFNKIIETVPELGTVLAQVLGGLSVMRLLGLSPKAGSTMGKTFGKALGRGLLIGWLLALPTIAVELHDWVRERRETIINAGIDIGEFIVNGMIDAVNLGIRSINEAFDALNVLGKFGVDAPEIGEIGHVDWGPFREDMKEGERIVAATTKGMRQKFGDMPKAAQEHGGKASRVLNGFLRDMSGSAQRNTKDVAQASEQNLGKAEQSAKVHGKGAGRGIAQPYQAASSVAVTALHTVEKQTNKALKGLKQKPINFGIKAPSSEEVEALHRQRGGPAFVGGQGTGDIVPAMLEPGEVVLNRKAVRALGGAGRANRINKRFPRFQGGGMVDPAGPGTGVVNPAIADVVGQWSKQYNAAINYGYDPGGGHVSPGHNVTGTATDTSPAAGWTSSATALFERGLRSLLGSVDQVIYGTAGIGMALEDHGRGNHAHIEWGMHPAVQGAIAQMVKAIQITGADHVAKNIAQGTTNMVRSAANKFLQKQMGGIGGGDLGSFPQQGTFSVSDMEALWLQVNRGTANAHTMAAIGMAESSGDPHAFGPPDGRGLWQIEWGMHPEVHKYGSPYDPVANARMAGDIFQAAGGYSPWVVYNTGAYQQFMQRGGVAGMQNGGILQRLAGGGQVNVGGASTAGVSQPINIEDLEFDPAALAAGAVRGHGGESPSTPLQDWFQMMFGTAPVKKMKDIVGGINLRPDRFTNMATSYGKALDADELATVAQALETEDPITGAITYPLAPGRGDADGSRVAIGGLGAGIGEGWMDMELAELITVRNRILAAIPLVETLTKFVKQRADLLVGGKDSFLSRAKKIYNAAKRAYEQLKRRIGQLETQIQRLEGIKNPSDEQKKRLEQHKAKLQTFKENLPTLKVWMDAANFRVGAVGDVSTAFTEKGTALAGLTTQLKTDGAEDGSWPSLEELQGRTGRAGTIFDVKLEIDSALRAAGEAATGALAGATGAGPGELETLSADLLARQLEEERRRRVIAEAQTPVFEQFFGRTFHTGGIVGGVGNQGVTVQAGEGIFTEDQMAAMGRSNVTVVVEDGAVDPNKIRVVVNDELSSVAARATRVGGTKGQKAVYR